jgi:hypothetical protein
MERKRISLRDWQRVKSLERTAVIDDEPYVLLLNPETQGTELVPVQIEEAK